MLDSTRAAIVILAENGFYAKTVQKLCRKWTGERYSIGTIYKVAREEGVSFRDYRNGKGVAAEVSIKRCHRVHGGSKTKMLLPASARIRKKVA